MNALAKRSFSAIRHLAAAIDGKRVAAGEIEVVVSVWDFEDPAMPDRNSRLRWTRADAGWRSTPAAISRAVGSWEYKGVAIYSALTGELINARDKLGHVQSLSFSADGCRIYCCADRGPCTVLDGETGAIVGKYPRIERLFSSRFHDLELRGPARANQLQICRALGSTVAMFERATFAILDADFSSDRVCLSESGGPVRCIATEDGREIWRHVPRAGTHILTLAYSKANGDFYGVRWPYVRGGSKTLVRFDYHTGKATVVARLGRFALAVFSSYGDRLITSEGDVIDVASGTQRSRSRFQPAPGPSAGTRRRNKGRGSCAIWTTEPLND